jgi:hypothetical protein
MITRIYGGWVFGALFGLPAVATFLIVCVLRYRPLTGASIAKAGIYRNTYPEADGADDGSRYLRRDADARGWGIRRTGTACPAVVADNPGRGP